jgi:hypothetical protein
MSKSNKTVFILLISILLNLTIISMFITTSAFAEEPDQQGPIQIGSNRVDYGKDVAVDQDGNIYAVGYFGDTVDLDPGDGKLEKTASGISDIYITKYDYQGKLEWGFSIGSPGADMPHTIQVDDSGNFYVTGYIGGNADYDPSQSIAMKSANSGRDFFVAKYDTNGNYKWCITAGNAETNFTATDTTFEEGMDLCIDKDGNVIVAGVYDGTIDLDPSDGNKNTDTRSSVNGSRDSFVAKYDKDGNFLNCFSIGGIGQDHIHGVRAGSDGSIYIGGFFSDSADFDPSAKTSNLVSQGSLDAFIAKYDTKGLYIWAKDFGSSFSDQIRPGAMEIDSEDNLYVAGDFGGSIDFAAISGEGVLSCKGRANGVGDIFMAKLDNNGNCIWAKGIGGAGGDAAHRIDVDGSGNVYIAGWFSGSVDFDCGTGTAIFTSNSTNASDAFIAKYDPNGEYLWANTFGGKVTNSANLQMAAGLAVDSKGNSVLTGKFYLDCDFDTDPTKEAILHSIGDSDSFIVRYDTYGKINVAQKGSVETKPPFADVAEGCWAYDGVKYCWNYGLVNGTAADKFSPDANLTRAQLWTILARLDGQTLTGDIMAAARAWAMGAGITDGANPGSAVTREELAAMLWRYAKYKKYDVSVGEDTNILSYEDAMEISEYAIPAIQWACGAGVMNGSGNSILPHKTATRAQTAVMIMRFCLNTVK